MEQYSGCQDEKLFSLIQLGDEKAFAKLYDKYHRLIFSLSYEYLKNISLAEDVVQQTFLDLWESAPRLIIKNNVKGYLCTIARNLILKCIDEDKKRIIHSYEAFLEQNALAETMEEKRRLERKIRALYTAIEKLPAQQRKVCLLKLGGNIDNEQISVELGISSKTVRSHYENSIRILRLYLKQKFAYLMVIIIYL